MEKWQFVRDPHFIGSPQQYSDDAILCMMTLKVVYGLPYR
ncbi:transposase [Candidatus Protochlamydia phocaeensis]